MRPPVAWPIMIGASGRERTKASKWSVAWVKSDTGICGPVRRVHDVARLPVPLDPAPPAIGR